MHVKRFEFGLFKPPPETQTGHSTALLRKVTSRSAEVRGQVHFRRTVGVLVALVLSGGACATARITRSRIRYTVARGCAVDSAVLILQYWALSVAVRAMVVHAMISLHSFGPSSIHSLFFRQIPFANCWLLCVLADTFDAKVDPFS